MRPPDGPPGAAHRGPVHGRGRPVGCAAHRCSRACRSRGSRPSVGDHPRARLYVFGDEGVQRGGRPIGQDRHPGPPEPAGLLDLNGHTYHRLLALRTSTPQPGLVTTDVRLVHLNRAGQPIPPRAHQDRAQPMQHRPCGRIRADLQRPLQAQRDMPSLPEANIQQASNHTSAASCGGRTSSPP